MKKISLVFLCFLYVIPAVSQLNPQSKKITERYFKDADTLGLVTPALKKKRGFTNYDELIQFISSLKETYPDKVEMTFIGESQKGYKIPLVKLTNPDSDKEKIKVWMQGGLHGNEPASTEGLLYLLHSLLNKNDCRYLLDRIELAVVPMANIDGYLKRSRYTANGLDLNRDQTKLMAPETIVLKEAASAFNPEVVVDFHEYNAFRRDFSKMGSFGIASVYDIMFLYSGNLNVPENMKDLTKSVFVKNAREILDENNLRYHDYMSTTDYYGDIHFNLGSINARSSATSYALTNAVSTLIEVRGVNLGRTSFQRRIATTYLVGISYLKSAYENVTLVKSEIDKAITTEIKSTVTSKRKVQEGSIEVLDLDTKEIIDMNVMIRNALESSPELVRDKPQAYIIDKKYENLIEKLNTLGIKTNVLGEETEFNVDCYKVIDFDKEDKPYEKMIRQSVKTKLVKKSLVFPVGTYFISTDQKNAPLLTELLEPEALNGFVSFGVLKVKYNQELPIYRLSKKN